MTPTDSCPCCSGRSFSLCCGPYLTGVKPVPTAEALMRSRYAAFATHNIDYLEETLAPEKRKGFNREATRQWACSSEWTSLEILSVQRGAEADNEGVVEFIARFSDESGKPFEHREVSRFERREGKWFYVEGARGSFPAHAEKTGRNDPCPCGSGKKYKKCCGA